MCHLLQWGRNLIVAEGRRLCIHGPEKDDASMGPQLDSCGRVRRRDVLCGQYLASMGPQLDSCGRLLLSSIGSSLRWASMGPQLDSCGRTAKLTNRLTKLTLQWGRNLIVAEGRKLTHLCDAASRFNGAAT